MTWRIFFFAVNGTPSLDAGWYGGRVTTCNAPIYMRTNDKDDAVEFTNQQDVIEYVRDWRSAGYPCHAVPTIHVIETI